MKKQGEFNPAKIFLAVVLIMAVASTIILSKVNSSNYGGIVGSVINSENIAEPGRNIPKITPTYWIIFIIILFIIVMLIISWIKRKKD